MLKFLSSCCRKQGYEPITDVAETIDSVSIKTIEFPHSSTTPIPIPKSKNMDVTANIIKISTDKYWSLQRLVYVADKNNQDAQYQFGMMHLNGEGVISKEYKEAFKWISKAANQGHRDAIRQIGMMYLEGKHVIKDVSKGLELIEKSYTK